MNTSQAAQPSESNQLCLATFEVVTGTCMGVGLVDLHAHHAFDRTKDCWMFEESVDGESMLEVMTLDEARQVSERVCPDRIIKVKGPSMGIHKGKAIPSRIELGDGRKFEFLKTCGYGEDLVDLQHGQIVVHPGLVYQAKG